MAAPAEPRPETDSTNAPSGRSDRDETISSSRAPSSGAGGGFDPPTMPGEVGTLGKYRVVKELGRGGMGAVYAAIDTLLDRKLALKVMLPEFAADAAAKGRFVREGRAAAKITHDNVVIIHEADERQGVPYIAMQFLEGCPLDQYLKSKGDPTIPQVLRIATETAAGLAAAHKIGLVHRDIKPGNLWLEAPNGRVKVLDFGLARPVDAESEVTKSGAIVGTPAYMSPEQARGEKVDSRTDLFSLGALMYRLCTGRLPFTGPTTMAVLMALGTEEPPPVRTLNPAVPESLAALVHQLLSKRADARPQSAAEVVKRVRSIMEELAAPRGRPVEQSTSQPQLVQPQVVYVPIQVTAPPPEQNPFADLDAPSTDWDARESDEDSVTVLEPVRKKPGAWLWPTVGFAALLALVAGVIIIIKNKDGTETKIEVPDGATVTVKDKGGKTLAQVGPSKQPAADKDADRKVAEWVIAQGGSVQVNGVNKDIKAVTDLPKDRFTLAMVNLGGTGAADTDLENLKQLKDLVTLHLYGTKVTGPGLAHLKEIKNLTLLTLTGAPMSDAGLVHLKELKSLKSLELRNTSVSDAGLAPLKELKNLTILNLAGTKVTAMSAKELAVSLPACAIEYPGGVIEAIDVDRKAAEWVLSLGGAVRVTGGTRMIKDRAELPKERFTLNLVNVLGKKVSNEELVRLKDLKELTTLDLTGTQVTGAGLEHLKDLQRLTHLYLHNTQVTDAGLVHLKDLKALTVLFLGLTQVTDAGLVHLKDLEALKDLNLHGTQLTDDGLAQLKGMKSLVWLYLKQTKVTAKGLETLHAARPACRIEHDGGTIEATDVDRTVAEWVIAQGGSVRVNGVNKDIKAAVDLPKERARLTGVVLNANKSVTDTGLAVFKDLKGLTELNLNGTAVTDVGLAHLKELKSLARLGLSGTQITNAGLKHLKGLEGLKDLDLNGTAVSNVGLEDIKELKGLRELSLSYTAVTDAGLEHLKDLQALTSLNLQGTKVTGAGLAYLKELQSLGQLWLRETKVGDAGLAHVQALKGLTHLDLNGTVVSDKGLVRIKELKSLTTLGLENTETSDAALVHFKDCKNLLQLDVRKTKVTKMGVEALHTALPGCRIAHDGGTIEPQKK